MIRKFVFTDLDDDEKDTIVDLIKSEGIRYSIKREYVEVPCEECDDEECFDVFPIFHVEVLTTMEKYDFLKVLLKKKMEKLNWLNKCYALEYGKEKEKKESEEKSKMKYTFLDHNEYTAGMVIDILDSENLRYKLETKKIGWGETDYLYNITIDATPEHILFCN